MNNTNAIIISTNIVSPSTPKQQQQEEEEKTAKTELDDLLDNFIASDDFFIGNGTPITDAQRKRLSTVGRFSIGKRNNIEDNYNDYDNNNTDGRNSVRLRGRLSGRMPSIKDLSPPTECWRENDELSARLTSLDPLNKCIEFEDEDDNIIEEREGVSVLSTLKSLQIDEQEADHMGKMIDWQNSPEVYSAHTKKDSIGLGLVVDENADNHSQSRSPSKRKGGSTTPLEGLVGLSQNNFLDDAVSSGRVSISRRRR